MQCRFLQLDQADVNKRHMLTQMCNVDGYNSSRLMRCVFPFRAGCCICCKVTHPNYNQLTRPTYATQNMQQHKCTRTKHATTHVYTHQVFNWRRSLAVSRILLCVAWLLALCKTYTTMWFHSETESYCSVWEMNGPKLSNNPSNFDLTWCVSVWKKSCSELVAHVVNLV